MKTLFAIAFVLLAPIVAHAQTPVTTGQTAGTLSATPNTWTQVLASAGSGSPARKGALFTNNSAAVEFVFFGPAAPTGTAAGIPVQPNASISAVDGSYVLQDTIWAASATASATYVLAVH